jgi:hypothetical protein
MKSRSLPQRAISVIASDKTLASAKSIIRRAMLTVLVMAASICNHARADSIDAAMCASVGENARYTATQRDAGVSEARMRGRAIKEFAGAALPGVLKLVHVAYSDPVIRHIAPDKTFELYRLTCMSPYSVATTRSVGDAARFG